MSGDPGSRDKLENVRAVLIQERIERNDGNTPYVFTRKQGEVFWQSYYSVENSEYPVFPDKY